MEQRYPDITDLLEAKLRRRRELAALSWEEKVSIIRQMQLLLPQGAWQAKSTNLSSGISAGAWRASVQHWPDVGIQGV
jgi:hypothetical protein